MKKIIILLLLINISFSCTEKKEETINLAAIFSLSGEAKDDNIGAVEGVKFAVDELNKNSEYLGKKVNLILIDNFSTAEGSKIAAEKAVEQDVVAIIGASWSSHSIEVAKVAQANKIPMITNVSTSPKVTQIGDYIFRVCFTDPYQGKGMASFAREEFDAKTAVIFRQEDGEYSRGLAEQFLNYFEQSGGKVLKTYDYKIEKHDFKDDLIEVQSLSPDIIFLPGHHETARIMSQSLEMGIEAKFLGGDGWGTPGFFEEGGTKIDEAYFTTHWSLENTSKASKEFVDKFGINEFTIAPAALSYDAINVFALAYKNATSKEDLKDAIQNVKNFDGATGTISLNQNGDPVNKTITIMKISDGKQNFYKSF